mgnify:CR=1 FL=1
MVHRPNTGTRMKALLLLTLLTPAMSAPAVVHLSTEVWEGNPRKDAPERRNKRERRASLVDLSWQPRRELERTANIIGL